MADLPEAEHAIRPESAALPRLAAFAATPIDRGDGSGASAGASLGWPDAEPLADLSHRISGGVDLETILRLIVTSARTLLSADFAALALDVGVEVRFVVEGGAETVRYGELTISRDSGISGLVLRTGRPYRTTDYAAAADFQHDPTIADCLPLVGRVSALAVPVRHGEILGVLEVVSAGEREFTDADETFLDRIAAIAADAIVNARVLAGERESRLEVEALLAATASLGVQEEPEATLRTLVEQAAKLLQAERATYAVFHDGRVVIPCVWQDGRWIDDEHEVPQGGIAKLVWDTGKPYRTNHIDADPYANPEIASRYQMRSQLTVPLLAPDSERLGLVSVNNSGRSTGFSDRDEMLLLAFCEYGSAVLRRAIDVAARRAAEEEAQLRRREVEALLEAADRINGATEPADVWQQVVQSAATLTGVQRATLLTEEHGSLMRRFAWQDGNLQYEPLELPLEGTISGEVFRTQKPRLSNNLAAEPLLYESAWSVYRRQTILSLPIVGREGHSLGVLSLHDHIDGTPLGERDLRLAEGLVHHAAVALERASLTARLRAREERFRSLVQNTSDIIALIDSNGGLIYISPSVTAVLGYRPESLMGDSARELIHAEDLSLLQAFIGSRRGTRGSTGTVEFRVRHSDGTWHSLEALVTNRLDEPSVGGIVLNIRDVTERVRLEDRLRYQAYHDVLTDLPNRALYLERLEHALRGVANGAGTVGVLFLDLDRFKVINDSLGHRAGDELLVAVGRRLSESVQPEDTVARFGGDEFAILLRHITDSAEAISIAEHVLRSLGRRLIVRGEEFVTEASIGVAVSSAEPAAADELLRRADLALYRAKAMGAAQARLFDPTMDRDAVDRMELETDLRRALERNELRLEYQPEVHLASGAVSGLEALLRWQHPRRGAIPPSGFIPMAEETGLIIPIGEWALEEACRQAMRVQSLRSGMRPLTMSVNLSQRQMEQPDLVARLTDVLNRTGMDPGLLKLEMTESIMMRDVDGTLQTLRALKSLGVKVAIDDFGTGYSSLSYLQRFALDTLKIDQSFMRGLGQDASTAAIVQAIIALAHAIGMEVTAEGVETAEQARVLRALDCDYGQGFHLCRPVSSAELQSVLGD